MKRSDSLDLSIRKSKTRLNELAGQDSLTDSETTECGDLETKVRTQETQFRAAKNSEDAETRTAEELPAEGREVRKLIEKVELRDYLSEAASGKDCVGVAHELRGAIFGDDASSGMVPWEALLPVGQVEKRVDAATVGRDSKQYPGPRFRAIRNQFFRVDLVSAPVGERAFPVLTAGATASQQAVSAAKDAEAATFSVSTLSPELLAARYLVRIQDLARLAGMEESLRADLRGTLSEQMDKQVLNGDGTSPNVSGFLTEIDAPTVVPSDVADFQAFLAGAASAVDGKYATNLQGVRMLVGVFSWTLAASVSSASGDISIADYLSARSGGLRVSANMPAPKAGNKVQSAMAFKMSGSGSATAPSWGLSITRDPYSGAKKGEVGLTAHMLWNFALLRADSYKRLAFKTA